MKHAITALAAACLLVAAPTIVRAHGDAEILVASDVSGGGALSVDYEFESVSKVDFSSTVGPLSIYTGIFPPFTSLDADNPPFYALVDSTQVTLQITAIDDGKTAMKIDTTLLSAVGDSAVIGTTPFDDIHPTYQLQLTLPEGEFGEGRISFKLTATGPTTYAESPVYTIKISNGPLAPPDYDPASEDKPAVKCYSKTSKAISKFVATEQKILSKCLNKVQTYKARAALTTPPSNLASAQAAAEEACADASGTGPDEKTMLGQIDAAKAKALSTMQDACGTAGSGTLSDDDIKQQIGLASCRAEELTASTYGLAHPDLEQFTVRASQGGDTVTDHLPCLFLTASD